MSAKEIAAFLIDCKEDDLLGFREYSDYVAAIGPDGKKYIFDSTQIEQGKLAMKEKQTLAEAAAEGRPAATHAEKPSPKPRRSTPKRKTTRKKTSTSSKS